jgi:dipeptidyl-peptidase-4
MRLTLEEIGRLPLPGMDVPAAHAFAPDGSGLTYLHAGDDTLVRSLWWEPIAGGEPALLLGPLETSSREASLSREERLRRERTRTSALGVTEYAWARDAMTLVVPMGGRVLVATGPSWPAAALPVPDIEDAQAAAPSPDGRRVAVVRGGDVWVVSVASGSDAPARQITAGAEGGLFRGLPDYAASEELGRQEGLWWSRDSGRLAIARVDERGVPAMSISHLGAPQAEVEHHRYPFAGGPNAHVTLEVHDLASGSAVEVDLGMAADDYLARVVAEPSGGWLVAVLPREQRILRWLRVTATGSARDLWRESSDPWINLDDTTRVLADGRILRATEETGFRHLVLRGPDGSLPRQITAGDWSVTAVSGVDEEARRVLFVATADGATERHLYSVPLDAQSPVRSPERISAEPGWHEVTADGSGRRWVDRWSSLEHAPRAELRSAEAGRRPLHATAHDVAGDGVTAPRQLSLLAADGATPLHALLYSPAVETGAPPPPCVVWVYGGPHIQYAVNAWEAAVHPLRRYLAQHGAAVLVVDNRGSANRGLGFEAPLCGHLGGVEIDDQAAAVEQVGAMGLIDVHRIGIVGGSYGGFMTVMAMLRRPELFGVGVAIAPVTDWSGYDTAYTERYLGTPEGEPEAYRRSSVVASAAGLRGRLLLIHGAIDENVHLRHSTRLVAALQASGIDVELVVLPEDRHRVRTPSGLLTRDRRTTRHLLGGLGLPLPDEARAQEQP